MVPGGSASSVLSTLVSISVWTPLSHLLSGEECRSRAAIVGGSPPLFDSSSNTYYMQKTNARGFASSRIFFASAGRTPSLPSSSVSATPGLQLREPSCRPRGGTLNRVCCPRMSRDFLTDLDAQRPGGQQGDPGRRGAEGIDRAHGPCRIPWTSWARLAETAGLTVAGATWQKLAHPDPCTWIGSGKVRELRSSWRRSDATYVLFDDELSPGQQRKLEAALGDGVRIIDRTRLILDIFSQHAHSREGKLQVELAQYQYLLPRLAGMRAGLSQQIGRHGAGPVGLRGPGETQLELDRRQARRRIAALRAGPGGGESAAGPAPRTAGELGPARGRPGGLHERRARAPS